MKSIDAPKLNHGLLANWKIARRLLQQHAAHSPYSDLAASNLDAIERLLIDFEAVDAKSQVFRYPESANGDFHLQNRHLIDLIQMNCVLEAAAE